MVTFSVSIREQVRSRKVKRMKKRNIFVFAFLKYQFSLQALDILKYTRTSLLRKKYEV